MRSRVRRWLGEPLLHFLLAGAMLFVLHGLVSGRASDSPREIVIREGRVAALAEGFARTWLRPPTVEELQGLVDDYVAEEVFYREALALGLERDDTVVRRRLRQKLEFVSEDVASIAEPSDEELQRYHAEHAEELAEPARLSFEQVLLSRTRGDGARGEAEAVLALLRAGREPSEAPALGDPTLLPLALDSASLREIAATFGDEFASALDASPVGVWSGPVESGFGHHLVRVEQREPGVLRQLDAIRPAVLRAWQADHAKQANAALRSRLLAKYEIRIEASAAEVLARGRIAGDTGNRR